MSRKRVAGLCCALAWAGVAVQVMAAEEAGPVVSTPVSVPGVTGEEADAQRIVVTATRVPTQTMDAPVVTAPAVPLSITQTPASITAFTGGTPGGRADDVVSESVYSAGNIEARQYRQLTDVLQNSPGVQLSTNGNFGNSGSLYMRGLNSGNTLLQFDGMPMMDPAGLEGHYLVGLFTTDNIDQVEVMRGPQSVLYGSSATGGVINMTSRKGEGPFTGYASTEAGSRGTIRTRVGASAGNEKGDFSFGGSLFRTDGFNVMGFKTPHKPERDGTAFGNANLRLGWNPTNCLRFDLFSNYMRANVDFDNYGDPDDDVSVSKIERFMIRPQATLSLLDGRWEQTLGVGYVQTFRNEHGQGNKYRGETVKADYKSVFHLTESNTLVAGVDVSREYMTKYDQDWMTGHFRKANSHGATTTAFYLEDQVNFRDVLFATLGVRQLHHETFGDETVWKASAMYVLPTATRLKASVGTGFKAPTLSQMYVDYIFGGPYDTFGNPDLKPEKTTGWDLGVEQSLFCDRVLAGSTFFWNQVKDGILYAAFPDGRPGNTYLNQDRYKAWGFESFLRWAVTDSLSLSASHTWLRAKNDDDMRPVMGRPKHAFSANVDYRFLDNKALVSAGVKFEGVRSGWSGDLGSYALFRIAASYKLNDNLELFGRVENLLDKKYTLVKDYNTEGRAFYAGLTYSF